MNKLLERYGLIFYCAWGYAVEKATSKNLMLFCEVCKDGTLVELLQQPLGNAEGALGRMKYLNSLGISYIIVHPEFTMDCTTETTPTPKSPTQIEDAQAR